MDNKKKSPGRPPLGPDKMIVTNFHLTPQQIRHIRKNGGAAWLRKLIDADIEKAQVAY